MGHGRPVEIRPQIATFFEAEKVAGPIFCLFSRDPQTGHYFGAPAGASSEPGKIGFYSHIRDRRFQKGDFRVAVVLKSNSISSGATLRSTALCSPALPRMPHFEWSNIEIHSPVQPSVFKLK
jgi:hypothetical protein